MVRKPARYLAPIALAATIAATYLVVHKGLTHKHSTTTSHTVARTGNTVPRRRRQFPASRRFYVVRPGDSLSTIAAKTGVPVVTLEALNPSVDPNALQTNTRLRLRR